MASDLVGRESITPNDAGCQDIINRELASMGFSIHDYSQGDTTNTLAVLRFSDGPLVGYAGHTDVVSPGNRSDWRVDGEPIDPFKLTERGGELHGRGAADMKGGIAAMLGATHDFVRKHEANPRGVKGGLAFLITSDEEGSGRNGTKVMAQRLKCEGMVLPYCIVGEASSISEVGDRYYVGRRGSFHVDMAVHGIQGHVAKNNYISGVEIAAGIVWAMRGQDWDAGATFPGFGSTTSAVTESVSSSKTIPGSNTTEGENVVPPDASLRANWRYSPATDPGRIQELFMRLARSIYDKCRGDKLPPEVQFESRWRLSGEPFSTPLDSPLVRGVVSAINAELGLTPMHSTDGGTSDGRFIGPILGSHVVELGLPGGSIHGPNERIPTRSLRDLQGVYHRLIANMLAA